MLTLVKQTQNFVFALLKLIVIVFFDTLTLVSEAGHLPNIKNLFLQLTDWDGEPHQNLHF